MNDNVIDFEVEENDISDIDEDEIDEFFFGSEDEHEEPDFNVEEGPISVVPEPPPYELLDDFSDEESTDGENDGTSNDDSGCSSQT